MKHDPPAGFRTFALRLSQSAVRWVTQAFDKLRANGLHHVRAQAMAHQAGAALLTAMLTVTLVASLAAAALWQQWRGTEVETAERARAQALWVLTGALDWARLILREDARTSGVDHLAEPWAVPLEEARLSTFLAAGQNQAAGSPMDSDNPLPQAFLSGRITDLQGRMNVLNLVEGGRLSVPTLNAFGRLYELLGLPAAELGVLAENLRFALDTSPDNGSARRAPLLPQRVEQLAWLGLSASSLAALRPHITLLPVRTPVNLNTASATVLYACVPGLDLARARQLVTTRQLAHWHTLADAAQAMGLPASTLVEGQHAVSTRYFEVAGRLRLDAATVEERSVLQRDGLEVRTLWRERGSLQ